MLTLPFVEAIGGHCVADRVRVAHIFAELDELVVERFVGVGGLLDHFATRRNREVRPQVGLENTKLKSRNNY